MNTQEFHDELKAKQYDPAIAIDRPVGYAMGEHQHPFDACALITAGDITLVVDGVSTRYAAGDVFTCQPARRTWKPRVRRVSVICRAVGQ